jgi:hypothetical protein
MGAIVSNCLACPRGIEAVLPLRAALDLDNDVRTHILLDLQGQTFPVIPQGGAVEVPSASKAGEGFAFS